MPLSRRKALTFLALLSSCSSLVAPSSLAAVITDAQLINDALIKITPVIALSYPALLTSAGVTPEQISNGSDGWLDLARSLLTAQAAQGAPASGASSIQTAIDYFNRFMTIIVPITTAVNPALGATIGGVAVLIGVIEAILNPTAAPPVTARAKALAPGVTPDAARATLRAYLAAPISPATKPRST